LLDSLKERNYLESQMEPIDDGKLKELEIELKEWEKDLQLNKWGYDEGINSFMKELYSGVLQIKKQMEVLVDSFNYMLPYINGISEEARIIDLSRDVIGREKEKARKGEKRITVTFTEEVIQFDTGKVEVAEKYFPALEKIAEVFKDVKDYKVVIEGHTDSIGSRDYNLELSQKRAKNIMNHFVSKYGLNNGLFVPIGYGEDRPVAANNTPEGRQKNRRVEFVLVNE